MNKKHKPKGKNGGAVSSNKNILIIVIAAVLIVGAYWVISRNIQSNTGETTGSVGGSNVSGSSSPTVGATPPDFTLTALDGKKYHLADLKGHPVWLNFWATWCPWCKKELPGIEDINSKMGGKILILGIDEQESASTVQSNLQSLGINYPVVLDPNGEVGYAYALRGIPSNIFINAQGQVTGIYPGAFSDEDTMLQYVNQAIGAN